MLLSRSKSVVGGRRAGSRGAHHRAGQPRCHDGGGGDALLEVSGLMKYFPVTRGVIFRQKVGAVQAVDKVDFSVPAGQTPPSAGEST